MISILIPTINRSEFLLRALNYYHIINYDGQIIIGDSSDEECHKDAIRKAISEKFTSLKILYTHYPKDKYTIHSVFKEMINQAKTPYCVFSGDDDFLVPAGLYKCVDFLENNSGYSAAHGLRLDLSVENDLVYGNVDNIKITPGLILDSEQASERWVAYMRNGYSTQYYVHPTYIWREMYMYIDETPTRFFGEELLPCSLTALLGKVKEIELISTVFQVRSHSFSFYVDSIFHLLVQSDCSKTLSRLRDILINTIHQKDNVELTDAKEIVERELWYLLATGLLNQYSVKYMSDRQSNGTLNYVKNLLKKCLGIYYANKNVIHNNNYSSDQNQLGYNKKVLLKDLIINEDNRFTGFKAIYQVITSAQQNYL